MKTDCRNQANINTGSSTHAHLSSLALPLASLEDGNIGQYKPALQGFIPVRSDSDCADSSH